MALAFIVSVEGVTSYKERLQSFSSSSSSVWIFAGCCRTTISPAQFHRSSGLSPDFRHWIFLTTDSQVLSRSLWVSWVIFIICEYLLVTFLFVLFGWWENLRASGYYAHASFGNRTVSGMKNFKLSFLYLFPYFSQQPNREYVPFPPCNYVADQKFSSEQLGVYLSLTRRLNNNSLSGAFPVSLEKIPQLAFLWVWLFFFPFLCFGAVWVSWELETTCGFWDVVMVVDVSVGKYTDGGFLLACTLLIIQGFVL